MKYLYTDAGQKIFAQQGYRPVVKADLDSEQFPTPCGLFTIDSPRRLGQGEHGVLRPDNGSITKIEDSLGHGASG